MTGRQLRAIGVVVIATMLGCASSEDEEQGTEEQSTTSQLLGLHDSGAWSDARHLPRLRPVLNCVAADSTNRLVAHFGYRSSWATTLQIPVGPFNALFPPPFFRGQPTSFPPGDRDNVFTVSIGAHGRPVQWKVGLSTAFAWEGSPPCVPIFSGALSATVTSGQSIAVAWSAATDFSAESSNIIYDICSSTEPGTCASDFVVAATTGPGAVSWTVTGLAPETTYYFLVRAKNPAGEADANIVEVSATTCLSDEMACDGQCGITMCGGRCTDTKSDALNCGVCGHSCQPPGTTLPWLCLAGECCTQDSVLCGGACRQLSSDPSNCGACGSVCPIGSMCYGGQCQGCAPNECPIVGTGGLVCRSTLSDPLNCGACGHQCPTGASCTGGVCSAGTCNWYRDMDGDGFAPFGAPAVCTTGGFGYTNRAPAYGASDCNDSFATYRPGMPTFWGLCCHTYGSADHNCDGWEEPDPQPILTDPNTSMPGPIGIGWCQTDGQCDCATSPISGAMACSKAYGAVYAYYRRTTPSGCAYDLANNGSRLAYNVEVRCR